MIDVSAVHTFSSAMQQRGMDNLHRIRHARKKESKHAGETRPVNPAHPTAVTTKRPAMEFTTDWRTMPEYNPHGLPAEDVIHPDPVNANRMASFKQAADRLAAHADRRIDEIRKQGK